MGSRKKNPAPVEAEQAVKILYRESAVQQQRLNDLEDALVRQNYERVDKLISSLDSGLRQLLDEDGQVVELQVKSRHKISASQ
jgi:hypothetical protein